MFSLDTRSLSRAIEECLDARTIAKGLAYCRQRRVRNCTSRSRAEGWFVTAEVRGSNPYPYAVEIEIRTEGEEVFIEGACSCPMEMNCKHVAAALLQAAETPASFFPTSPDELREASNVHPPNVRFPQRVAQLALNPPWRSWLHEVERAAPPQHQEKVAAPGQAAEQERLLYILRPQNGRVKVDLVIVRRLKTGAFSRVRNFPTSTLLYQPHATAGASPGDLRLIRQLLLAQPAFNACEQFLDGAAGAEILTELLATGRCHWRGHGKTHPALVAGPPRAAKPAWQMSKEGEQRPGFEIEPAAAGLIATLAPPWYVDEGTGTCGPLETGLSPELARAWLGAPPISPRDSTHVIEALTQQKAPLPLPQRIEVVELTRTKPVPCLRLHSAPEQPRIYQYGWANKGRTAKTVSFARLEFDYGGNWDTPANDKSGSADSQ